jgi:glycosyltransferase involved in cell wall biosynthesis
MKVLFFANKMPDLCGAFLHDIDLGIELQKRGHQVVFLSMRIPKEGYNGGTYRGFRFMHYSAASSFLDTSDVWICPHSPVLPELRNLNARGYSRPIIATCHYDGNYNTIRYNGSASWSEMLLFINGIMEVNYRKNISPWPSQIRRTDTIRPLMHRDKIEILEPFRGDCITLVNANQNKGVHVFIDLARRMPDRKFLGVIPYYGERNLPPAPGNIEWVPFNDDIRTILKRTRILLAPSYYESFGRIAVEAMLNRIPVLYSNPMKHSVYPGGSTEGLHEWIQPAGIACDREAPDEWIQAIQSLDGEDAYVTRGEQSRQHIEAMNIFTEATRIAGLVEDFSRQNPIVQRVAQPQPSQAKAAEPGRLVLQQPAQGRQVAGFGFSNGRLKILR